MQRNRWLILAAVAAGRGSLLALTDTPEEVRVKTAVVVQLARFVEWPGLYPNLRQFTICLAEKDSWIEPMEGVTRGQTVGGKEIAVRRITRPEEVASCQVAILGRNVKLNLRAAVARAPILTISDEVDCLAEGGMVGLAVENGRVVFSLSPRNARERGIRFSSKLIRLARIPRREE